MAITTPSYSQSTSSSTSGPFAPEFFPTAKAQTEEAVGSAKTAATDQKARLQTYIQHLYRLREIAKMAAKGIGQRAGGMQNPVAMYNSMVDLANKAGVPMDAQISQALQQSNNIENTLNSILLQASDVYTKLASIPKQQSQSQSTATGATTTGGGGGSSDSGGGRGRGGGGIGDQSGQGVFTDIYGTKYKPGVHPTTEQISQVKIGPGGQYAGGSKIGFLQQKANEEYQKHYNEMLSQAREYGIDDPTEAAAFADEYAKMQIGQSKAALLGMQTQGESLPYTPTPATPSTAMQEQGHAAIDSTSYDYFNPILDRNTSNMLDFTSLMPAAQQFGGNMGSNDMSPFQFNIPNLTRPYTAEEMTGAEYNAPQLPNYDLWGAGNQNVYDQSLLTQPTSFNQMSPTQIPQVNNQIPQQEAQNWTQPTMFDFTPGSFTLSPEFSPYRTY